MRTYAVERPLERPYPYKLCRLRARAHGGHPSLRVGGERRACCREPQGVLGGNSRQSFSAKLLQTAADRAQEELVFRSGKRKWSVGPWPGPDGPDRDQFDRPNGPSGPGLDQWDPLDSDGRQPLQLTTPSRRAPNPRPENSAFRRKAIPITCTRHSTRGSGGAAHASRAPVSLRPEWPTRNQ